MADVGTSVVCAPLGGVQSLPSKDGLKRFRSQSTADFKASPSQQDETIAQPLLTPHFHEPMVQYLHRLKTHVHEEFGGVFAAVNSITGDGLYIHKRPVRVMGDALGQTAVLQQAGSVFHHVVLYVKAGDQLAALDYGPEGDVDMTSNWTQAVPCGPVLHRHAESPSRDGSDLPLLHIRAPHHAIDHEAVQQAIDFVGGRKYHAILNNCMQNCDLLVRVMTGGLIRDAPLVYDVVCGQMPQEESPLLLMFLLMTKMSWFQVCDAASQVTAYLSQHTCPAPLEGLGAEFAPNQATGRSIAHRDKVAKGEASGAEDVEGSEATPADPKEKLMVTCHAGVASRASDPDPSTCDGLEESKAGTSATIDPSTASKPTPGGDSKQTFNPTPAGDPQGTSTPTPGGDTKETSTPVPSGDIKETSNPIPASEP